MSEQVQTNDEGTAVRPVRLEIVMHEDRWGNHVLSAVCPTTGRVARTALEMKERTPLTESLDLLPWLLDGLLPDELP